MSRPQTDPWAPRADRPPLVLVPLTRSGPWEARWDVPALELVAVPDAYVLPELPVEPEPRPEAPAAFVPEVPATPIAVRRPVLEVLGATVVLGLVAALVSGFTWAGVVLVVIVLIAAGLWVLAFHPMLVFASMAFMLGFAPGVQTPVVNISITFVLSLGIWVSLAVMPDARHRAGWPVVLSGILIVVALFSVIGNPITSAAISDFVRWSVTTAAVYPLFVLPAAKLAQIGRWFVGGCTAAATVGIAFVVLDPDGSKLFSLSVLGYGPNVLNSRYVLGDNGPITRLTGTYVDPNLGGLIMAAGLILALALLRGGRRILASGLLVMAIALTLSRADAGSVAVAGVLLVLFSSISGKVRGRLLALGVVAAAGLLAVPAVQTRLANSFGSKDRGSSARWEAVAAMPDQLRGHWFFGRGFGAPELVDPAATAVTNYVANAPLLSVYRGGVIVGIAFTVLMLVSVGAAWRLLRRRDLGSAALGAGFLGLTLVAFQLDIPIVTLTPATLVFALLLAFLGNPDAVRSDDDPDQDEATSAPRPRVGSFEERFSVA